MTAPARGAAPFVAVLAAGLLAACGGAEESSSTSTKASSTSEADESARSDAESRAAESSDAEAYTSEAPDGPAQEELTKQQIVDALPEESDAPRDYVEDPKINPDAESTRETDPESCSTLR